MAARIYFDNAATTPLDPRVLETMLPLLGEGFGNPSSLHEPGRRAREAVEAARRSVAGLLNADAEEIVFTASGTEADNMAMFGVFDAGGRIGGHLAVSAFEHPAVLEAATALERRGVSVSRIPLNGDGLVEPDAVAGALRSDTRLVSVMAANNVVGTAQPLAEIARVVRRHGALLHCDAVQAVGRVPLDLKTLPVDLLSLSAHKLHGPQGVGALFVRRGVTLEPILHGGGQERGLRPATENVAGIVGFGRAAEISRAEMANDAARLVALRDRLLAGIQSAVPTARLIGHPWRRLPGHLALLLDGWEGDAIRLLLDLDRAGVSVASGSACSSGHAGQPSHVLLAMGFDPIRARGSLRLSLGRFNNGDEVDRFLEIFPNCVQGLRPTVTAAARNLQRSAA